MKKLTLVVLSLVLIWAADASAYCYYCTWAGCADNGMSGYDSCRPVAGECVFGNPCAMGGTGCPGPKCDPAQQGRLQPTIPAAANSSTRLATLKSGPGSPTRGPLHVLGQRIVAGAR